MPPKRCRDSSRRLRFARQNLRLCSHRFQFIALPDQQNHQGRQAQPRQIENLAHLRVQSAAGEHHRLRMLRPPPPDRPINQRNVQKNEYAVKRTDQRTPVRVIDHRPQNQIGNIEQPQHQRGRQARVPCPIHAPRRLRPNRPGKQHHRAKRQANLRGGYSQPIPLRFALEQESEIAHKAHHKRGKRGHPARRMQVKNSLHDAHGQFVRGQKESAIRRRAQQQDHRRRAKDLARHDFSRPMPSIASHTIFEVLCFDTVSEPYLANPLFSHRFPRPEGRGVPRQTTPSHSSKRYSPKSHTAVKKMMSNAIRNASQSQRSAGSSANSALVASVLAMSNGVSSGSKSSGSSSSRMRACAEIADNVVPVTESPRLPRNSTSASCGTTPSSGILYKTANIGSSSSSVISRKSVLAQSFDRKIANGSETESRSALSVSFVCSRKKPGCSISDAANRNASQSKPGPNRRDSSLVGSNVKLNSTTTIRMKTTVVVSSSRDRNSVRSSLPSRTVVLEGRLI